MRQCYKNGSEIDLVHNGCDGCDLSIINGVPCHEHGCPYAWRDFTKECVWCGDEFYSDTWLRVCPSCHAENLDV